MNETQSLAYCRAVRWRGFTLIEVMITVAIIAILAGIAVPSYSDYLRRGALPEAFTNLSDFRVKLEQYYQDHRGYGTSSTRCANVNPPSWSLSSGELSAGGKRFFTIMCTPSAVDGLGNYQGYTLTATGVTGTRAQGHVYTITAANVRKTTQFKGASVDQPCWLTTAACDN
jgi:type IV pilus assembly protein PilE